jgi:predicted transcriptional regulator
MTQFITLNNIQKAIFLRLSQNKAYAEIAEEFDVSVADVEFHVKTVLSLVCFEKVNKELAEIAPLMERLN